MKWVQRFLVRVIIGAIIGAGIAFFLAHELASPGAAIGALIGALSAFSRGGRRNADNSSEPSMDGDRTLFDFGSDDDGDSGGDD